MGMLLLQGSGVSFVFALFFFNVPQMSKLLASKASCHYFLNVLSVLPKKAAVPGMEYHK